MNVIAMVPVRNEAWVLNQALTCLSQFCDVVIVSDRESTDGSIEIYRRFPKVVVLHAPPDSRIREQRWQLLDAARGYDGTNLLWACDADELQSPGQMRGLLERRRAELTPGTPVEVCYYTLWNEPGSYRADRSHYRPQWKRVGLVDDRRSDFDRSDRAALHEPRVPGPDDVPALRDETVALLHLQWMIPHRNQMKQAWYRCREWIDGGKTAASINQFYSVTFPDPRVRTAAVRQEWIEGIPFPDPSADTAPSWHEADIRRWFDERGIEFFEPLEIWHVAPLAHEFRQRTRRRPRPDRSYLPPWQERARRFGRRAIGAVKRRWWSPP